MALGGYSDWFLPSAYELVEVYNNLGKVGLGYFVDTWYWSSSELNNRSDAAVGVYHDFVSMSGMYRKIYPLYVRCARAY